MEFEWDEAKNAANIGKHGIAFEDAIHALDGLVVTKPGSRHDYREDRKISICLMGSVLIVVVVHTERNGKTRIISARRARRDEREVYQAALLASAYGTGTGGAAG
ncbi:MAG: BrnT family toxin [Phyllobacteriaceae bacterium]|nr:BrnT family toxin [Phyllobacteriaceae bacterium]